MGCFSYMCVKCGKAIYSDKYDTCVGEEVNLGRLVDGRIVEWMKGRYDSYGCVHIPDFHNKDFTSEHWVKDGMVMTLVHNEEKTHKWISEDWGVMVQEQFNNDSNTGIVAIHEKCWDENGWGKEISQPDPNQGWCDPENPEDEEDDEF